MLAGLRAGGSTGGGSTKAGIAGLWIGFDTALALATLVGCL